jgi:hypothetical protein
MHQPWGGEHRVYRKDLGEPWGEVDWCDACGTEVYSLIQWAPGAFVRYDPLD